MARKSLEPSAAVKAADAAREKYKAAKEAAKAKDTEHNRAALEKARVTLAAAVTVENRERFVRVAGKRTVDALAAIAGIGGCFNPKSYNFTEADVGKITEALKHSLEDLCVAANKGLNPTNGNGEKTGPSFTL